MNKEKLQEFVESFKKQFDVNKLKAAAITTEDIMNQDKLSKEYENSSDKEGFLKSRKGLQFVTLTCNVGNMQPADALKFIREKNGVLGPCPDWNGYDEY